MRGLANTAREPTPWLSRQEATVYGHVKDQGLPRRIEPPQVR